MIAKSDNLVVMGMAFSIFVICLFRGPSDQLIEGFAFHDADDVLRMVQVIDLWEGQSWHDLTQRRLNPPPVGVEMHWSRLPDIPLVGVFMVAEKFMERDEAILFTSNIVPPFLGSLFFLSFVWASLPLVGRRQLPFAGLTAMVMLIPLTAFDHGRVDHHGWQVIFAMITAGGVLRACLGRRFTVPLAIASCSGALGLWVGAEGIVNVGVAAIVLTIHWFLYGGRAAYRVALFGFLLTVCILLIYPLALPVQRWMSPACDAFSIVTLGLSGTILAFGGMISLLERLRGSANRQQRFLVGGAVGICLLWLFSWTFPDCFEGPYAGISPEFNDVLLQIGEAQPLWKAIVGSPSLAATLLVLPLIGFLLSVWRIQVGVGRYKVIWTVVALLIGSGIVLVMWQIRGLLLANAYAGIALAWFVARVGRMSREKSWFVQRIIYKGGPALGIALTPFVAEKAFESASVEYVAPRHEEKCEWMRAVSDMQRDPVKGSGPLLIAAPLEVAPIFLLFTEHGILGSMHHRNSVGVRDTLNVLHKDEDTARSTVADRSVNILVACKWDKSVRFLGSEDGSGSFYYELAAGMAPEWLDAAKGESNVRIYYVDPRIN